MRSEIAAPVSELSASSEGRLFERRRRSTIKLLERSGEVAVTRESKMQGEVGEIVILRDQIQCSREPQPQVIAIERQAFDLLKSLGEIHGGSTDLRCNFLQ